MDVAHGTIWTIGHSTREIEELIALLRAHRIRLVADVRSAPSSSRHPQFNKDALRLSLGAAGIGYEHFALLGGLRPVQRDVPKGLNGLWRNGSFKNYADWAVKQPFACGLTRLKALAAETTVTYMCSEAVPWRCHRMLISDHLTLSGWRVRHITSTGDPVIHVPGKWGARPVFREGMVIYPPAYLQLPLFTAAGGDRIPA